MPEENENRRLDDQLAAFTDQVLSRDASSEPPVAEEDELRRLQAVVLRLKRAGTQRQPSPSYVARLRSVLQQEWKRSGSKSQAAPNHRSGWQTWVQTVQRYLTRAQSQRLALPAAVMALIVLLAVGLLVSPPVSAPLSGTAGLEKLLWPGVLVLGLLLILLVLWLARPKGP